MTTDQILAGVLRRLIQAKHGVTTLGDDGSIDINANVQLTDEEYALIGSLL